MNIKDLFTFPIVMVDGENEERKERDIDKFGDIPGQEVPEIEYDIVYGEARFSYHDFIGIEDRWLPTKQSLRRALKKKFDACIVRFDGVGQFLVPMNKEDFEEKLIAFAKTREEEQEDFDIEIESADPDVDVEHLKEVIKNFVKNGKE